MSRLRRAATIIGIGALAALPVGVASASSSHAGQHGNHCGRGHAKHVKGQGGLKIGKSCVKAPHSGGTDDGQDESGDTE